MHYAKLFRDLFFFVQILMFADLGVCQGRYLFPFTLLSDKVYLQKFSLSFYCTEQLGRQLYFLISFDSITYTNFGGIFSYFLLIFSYCKKKKVIKMQI